MRRLARRLFSLLSALSLLLCVATALLLIRSRAHQDALVYGRPGGRLVELLSMNGDVAVRVSHPWPNKQPLRWHSAPADAYALGFVVFRDPSSETKGGGLGIEAFRCLATPYVGDDGTVPWQAHWFPPAPPPPGWFQPPPPPPGSPGTNTLTERVVFVPHWMVIVAAGLLPCVRLFAWGGRQFRGWRRRLANHCPQCGYDLRATPGRCPECGAVPAAGVKA